jgi:tRNA (guanine-N7-)-methyltransferase
LTAAVVSKKTGDASGGIQPPAGRLIKNYALREGRITKAQKRGLARYLPRFGIALTDAPPDWRNVFNRGKKNAPLVLEIGCGRGEAALAFARENPHSDYIAADVFAPGLGALVNAIAAEELNNIRVIRADAVWVLRRMFADGALAAVHIFFPDPWPKKRHHKRRLINAAFVGEVLARKIAAAGVVRIATDCPDYAQQIAEAMTTAGLFAPAAGDSFIRPLTKFAQRAAAANRPITNFFYRRTPAAH